MQYKAKYALPHHPRTYTNVEKVHVCIKVTLKGEFSSVLPCLVVRGSDYESQGSNCESHC